MRMEYEEGGKRGVSEGRKGGEGGGGGRRRGEGGGGKGWYEGFGEKRG